MAIKVNGIESLNRNLTRIFDDISEKKARRAVAEACIIGQQYAVMLTPVDTANLINSRFIEIQNTPSGFTGRVGYTANYAAAVHAMSGKLKGQPRSDFGTTRAGVSFGGGTGKGRYWDPDAEPGFLRKGFERDGKDEIEQRIIEVMKL